MWPRSDERGIYGCVTCAAEWLCEASMWPRSDERGIGIPFLDHVQRFEASMWPRSDERGIPGEGFLEIITQLSLQCGRAQMSAESWLLR